MYRIYIYLITLIIITISCKGGSEQGYEYVPASHFFSTTEPVVRVQVNPSGRNPLAALVDFTTDIPCRVAMLVSGAEPLEHAFENFGTRHTLPVVGLYAQTKNNVTFTLTDERGNYTRVLQVIETEDTPDWVPTMTIEVIDTTKMQPGWHLAEIDAARIMNEDFTSCPVMFDNNGDVRWLIDMRDEPIQWAIERDGTLFRTGGMGFINHWNLLGSKVSTIRTPFNHLHHDIQIASDGTYVALIDRPGRYIIKNGQQLTSMEDYVVQIDKSSGSIVREWDLREVLDVQRIAILDGGRDWFHANSIWWDAASESIITSGRNQGVVKIDKNNHLKWVISTHKGWGQAGVESDGETLDKFLLTAVNSSGVAYDRSVHMGEADAPDGFSWPYAQHAAMVMPNGHIFIFDNGANRNYSYNNNYSRAVEYKVDEQNMTIQQVWVWSGKNDGHFSSIISDVDYDPQTKNRLITSGQEGEIIEINDVGVEVFKAHINFKNIKGIINQWAGFDIMYRSERLPLYP